MNMYKCMYVVFVNICIYRLMCVNMSVCAYYQVHELTCR